MELYKDSSAFVQTAEGPTDNFTTTSGVLQGDTLAPLLFIVVLDYVLRRVMRDEDAYVIQRRRSSRYPAVYLLALAYADDIALICRDPAAAQRILARLEAEARRVGLRISAKKTEVLHVNTDSSPPLRLSTGEEIRVCDEFTYLGVKVMDPDSLTGERRTQAWRAARSLSKLFHSTAADSTKARLFKSVVESVLSYGLEAVPVTPTRAAALDRSHRCLLRYAPGVHFPETISNTEVYARTRILPLSVTLRRNRFLLLGHIIRDDARRLRSHLPRTPLGLVLANPPTEPFRHGMARLHTLHQTFLSDLQALGLSIDNITITPKNSYRWRVLSLR